MTVVFADPLTPLPTGPSAMGCRTGHRLADDQADLAHSLAAAALRGTWGSGGVLRGLCAEGPVGGSFEAFEGAQGGGVAEGQRLAHEDAGDVLRWVDPVVGVEDAGPGH